MVRNYFGVAVICGLSLNLSSIPVDGIIKGESSIVTNRLRAAEPKTAVRPHHKSAAYQLYLTFDDGPSDGSRVVDQLSLADSVNVNVFIIGENATRNPVNRQILQDYRSNPFVEIGNHSYSHAKAHYHTYFDDPAGVVADFLRSRDSLALKNDLVRLPGRNCFRIDGYQKNDGNAKDAADSLSARGFRIFGWDLDWRNRSANGISTHSAEEMLRLVEKMLEKQKTFSTGRLIILLHDQQIEDPALRTELQTFIRLIREDGRFEFGHLSDYEVERPISK